MSDETKKGTASLRAKQEKPEPQENIGAAVEKAMAFIPQHINDATSRTVKSGSFVAQSNQITIHSVEKMMTLQGEVLRASFNDMQNLVDKQGQPPAELASEAFRLMIDRSMEHVRSTLAATQEMHRAYLDLMEGYMQTMQGGATSADE